MNLKQCMYCITCFISFLHDIPIFRDFMAAEQEILSPVKFLRGFRQSLAGWMTDDHIRHRRCQRRIGLPVPICCSASRKTESSPHRVALYHDPVPGCLEFGKIFVWFFYYFYRYFGDVRIEDFIFYNRYPTILFYALFQFFSQFTCSEPFY